MTYSLLNLGDSYSIGEGVPLYDSFPYQTVQLLRKAGLPMAAPEIIAKTGWTTDELWAGIDATQLQPPYDLVTLLIGVNNEYRGRPLPEYATQFEDLLQKAITLAGGNKDRVFVLSIPDWGVTPFAHSMLPDAAGRDKAIVAGEIDAFNAAARQITDRYALSFIDITTHTRASGADPSMLAHDGLHPSGVEYRYWAAQLAARITPLLTPAQ